MLSTTITTQGGINIVNRQLFVLKFNSAKLKELNYSITTTFNEAADLNEVVSIGDGQALRSIRDIRHRTIDRDKVERLIREKELLFKRAAKQKSPWYGERIRWLGDKINRTMFVPDYVTIVIDHKKHYDYLYKNGFYINGKRYVRFSCSAGQARDSTVVFVCDEIVEELEHRLNNGRDTSVPVAPSKFNAYYGLCTSATQLITEPRFAVVKDYEDVAKFMANFDTETDWAEDDVIEKREVSVPMNRADGMGLLSPQMAERWAKDLELDYTPCQWIIRQSFIKGMVCVFPFVEFCEEVNGGSYLVDTIYKNENGEPVKVDLREVDVILTESQFKLWSSYKSVAQYVKLCHENKLYWGVASYTPKEAKNMLTLNYQFIQTLNLDRRKVEDLCKLFVEWIDGVSFDNRNYMLLFLLGVNNTEESIKRFMRTPDNWWIKALAANPDAKNDPYIRKKIRELIIGRIQAACMGEIFVPGNYQTLISDPYALMQHICGMKPTGLLKEGELYSKYWNDRGVKEVNTARSPQTYRCENLVMRIAHNEQTSKWYRYCYLGVIVSWNGHEVVNWGGADFDGDILATTSCRAIIDSVYTNELTVTYDAPKPQKKVFTQDDLFQSDLFAFGSAIGAITNKGTEAYALLPLLEEKYGKESEEVRLTESRLRQCCVAQSKQIDKTKIGKPVKGIPDAWTARQRVTPDDTEEEAHRKEVLNHCLLNRRPYFFKYRYAESKKEYYEYENAKQGACKSRFGKTIKQLEESPWKSLEQKKWLDDYYEYCPLIVSDSPMNLLCKYIESVDFEILGKCKEKGRFDWTIYIDPYTEYEDEYESIVACYDRHMRDARAAMARGEKDSFAKGVSRLKEKMSYICSNPKAVTNALVWYAFEEKPNTKKDALWGAYGKYMVEAAMGRNRGKGVVMFPMKRENGSIEYLGDRFENVEVELQ